MTIQQVEKYRKAVRILHWVHTGAFILLFLTGLVLFIPGLGFLSEGGWTRYLHRIGAAVFIIAPIIYIILNPKSAARGLKQAFTWGSDDMLWLKAAPRYYFLGDVKDMPPQGIMNTGQKVWWLLVIIFGVVLVITGLIRWFAAATAPPDVLLWMAFIHDIAFIVIGAMFFLHIYLGVLHPTSTEAWGAMVHGKISAEYARTHHGKWYEEITRDRPAEKAGSQPSSRSGDSPPGPGAGQ